jgi:hypothetical protein
VSDDDALLNYFAGEEAVAAMKAAGAPKDYPTASTPLVTLIEQISKRKAPVRVSIKRNDFALRMERR